MNRKLLKKMFFPCVALILVLLILYSGLQILESIVFLKEQTMEVSVRKTITKDGVDYFPRQDLNVILLMGIDREGPIGEDAAGRPVDMIAVLVFDEQTQECRVLNINRDTMVQMPMLDERSREAGTFFGQLAYSPTYGTGMADSCENVKKTVSNLLYGINIDYYIAMNMDAIPLLNDAVGGVLVNVWDDFSGVDPSITMGSTILMGRQALRFVQARGGVGDSLNLSRMERQKEYMDKFAVRFRAAVESDGEFVLTTYEQVAPYLVSDLPVSTLSSMVRSYEDYPITDMLSLEGENRLGESYYEFYPDEEKLDAQILDLFYAAK